jgi:signal transduction histidine kinase
MSPPNDSSKPSPNRGEGPGPDRAEEGPYKFPAAPVADAADAAHAQLAHELAGLLDGGLRNLGLAMSSLRDPPDITSGGGGDEDLLRRLQNANTAMQHMAKLIHRWMSQPGNSAGLHDDRRSLAECVESALRLLGPAAKAEHIGMHVEIDVAAANVPAGPIYPILANAIRNSIEAFAVSHASRDRRIEVLARLAGPRGEQLELIVRDTGPGVRPEVFDAQGTLRFGVTTKAGGHGVGLTLARDITHSLGGTLTLTNRRPHGAELVARLPVPNAISKG